MKFEAEVIPLTVDYDRIFEHLISKLSPTGNMNRNFKSLDAYKSFQAGFVQEVKGCKYQDVYVVSGKVLHSMRVNELPAECWVIINDSVSQDHEFGSILAAHCDCTAGAGETCTHVSAVLYCLAYAREIGLGKQLAVTDLPAYWTQPRGCSASQELYKPIDEVHFGRKTESSCCLKDYDHTKTDEDYKKLLKDIQNAGQEAVVSKAFFKKTELVDEDPGTASQKTYVLSLSMNTFFDKSNENKSLEELIDIGKATDWKINASNCAKIEELTRSQHADPFWFKMRYGRVTASIFAKCVKTNMLRPSKSLLRSIFRQNEGQSMPATLHGKRNERNGVEAAIQAFKHYKHLDLQSRQCGLIINEKYPFFAASPDYLINCSCCGSVVVEVKCPFKFDSLSREEGIEALLNRQQPYLKKNSDGNLIMNHTHEYYYQIQMQIFLSEAAYGVFVIWAPKFTLFFKITKNGQFWDLNAPKAENFFNDVLAPEILGHYFSALYNF